MVVDLAADLVDLLDLAADLLDLVDLFVSFLLLVCLRAGAAVSSMSSIGGSLVSD